MENSELIPLQKTCPWCGKKIKAFKRKDGAILMECPHCYAKSFSKKVGAKKLSYEVKLP